MTPRNRDGIDQFMDIRMAMIFEIVHNGTVLHPRGNQAKIARKTVAIDPYES